jgi:hypothetical protein
MELRLCSIAGGNWLDSILPTPEIAKRPHADIGLMFGRAVDLRLKSVRTGAELRATPTEGLVLASEGIGFDEQLLVSALHAIACAAVVGKTGEADNADILEAFVRGKRTFSIIPKCLRESGVVSCVTGDIARRFGKWIDSVDRNVLVEEVADMHGEGTVETYLSAIDDLKRTLKTATTIHGCDVCCLRKM